MSLIVLTAPEWRDKITMNDVKREMEVKPGNDAYDDDIEELLTEALEIGLPKAALRECSVEGVLEGTLTIDGMPFRSKLVVEKLTGVPVVLAYAATCGRELHDWAEQYAADPMYEFVASSIMKACIPYALGAVTAWARDNAGVGSFATLNPGSLPSWPVTGQKQVFGLLAGRENGYDPMYVRNAVGIELTESSLMVPLKSVSGLLFASSEEWHNCMRCKKADCPNRRSPMAADAEDMISTAEALSEIEL